MENEGTIPISKQSRAQKPLPVWLLSVIFIAIGLIFMCAYWAVQSFPRGLDEADNEARMFVAQNAYKHIHSLSVDIGPRVIGTVENEEHAVNYLLEQINEIIAKKSENVDIEVKHDAVSGFVNREPRIFRSVTIYRGLQNIAVKVTSRDANDSLNYILLNSHFDSVPLSPGAGDDGTMVAVMLELLRLFSRISDLKHSLVFLFNGGEEMGMPAAHGFIESNEWAQQVGVLVNLEVAGVGGKDLVFQVRSEHPWLMKAYKDSAPFPASSSLAQEMYDAGLMQSDTDYLNFKLMYDRLPAIDIAHSLFDFYKYHTKHDSINAISLGSLQRTGENVFELIRGLDKRSEIDNYLEYIDESGNVFFDYLGMFLIIYSKTVATVINSIVFVAVTLISVWFSYQMKTTQRISLTQLAVEYLIALVIQAVSIIFAFLVIFLIAWIMDVSNRSMSWFTNIWLVFGIYFVPFFLVNALIPYLYIKFRERKRSVSTSYYVQLALHAHANLLSIALIYLTILDVKSAFLILLGTMFYFLSTIINVVFNLINKGNTWIYLHCVGQILPAMYYFYAFYQFLITSIPMAGFNYDGATQNPEISIALFVCIFGLLSTGFYIPVFIMFRCRRYVLAVFAIVFLAFFIMAFTPLGFPYKELEPQRFLVWHTKRQFFDHTNQLRHTDSGYYIYGSDRHGPNSLVDYVPGLDRRVSNEADCKTFMMCGQPWWRIQYTFNRDYNFYVLADEPNLPDRLPKIDFLGKEEINSTMLRFNFVIAGPHFMNVQLSPLSGVNLIGWSFDEKIPLPNKWIDRQYYFINYYHGLSYYHYQDYEFSIVLEKPESWNGLYLFDIALSASWIGDESMKSKEFVDFTNSFPVWTNVQNWTSYHVGYQF